VICESFVWSILRPTAKQLPESLRGTVDLAIKDRIRLLRLPNTVHEKSGLYKLILPTDNLETLTPESIQDLATEVRPLLITDETGFLSRAVVGASEEAVRLFQRIRRQLRQITRKPFAYRFRRPEDLAHMEFPCAGAQKIWESHVEPGYRNNCAIRLAADLRLLGLTEEEAREKLFQRNEHNAIGLPSYELLNVTRSGYQHPFPYRHSCHDKILRRFCPLLNVEACQAKPRPTRRDLMGPGRLREVPN
jgi:DNA polymerase III psi subunit